MQRLIILAALFAFLGSNPAHAQQVAPSGKNYALLVSCENYDSLYFKQLPKTHVIRLQRLMLASSYTPDQVMVVSDRTPVKRGPYETVDEGERLEATKRWILSSLERLLGRITKADDSLIVLLSGHLVQFADDEETYFCPTSAALTEKSSMIPLSSVFARLSKCPAKRKMLILNGSRKDPRSGNSIAASQLKLVDEDRDRVPAGLTVLYASKPGQANQPQFFESFCCALKDAHDGKTLNISRVIENAISMKKTLTEPKAPLTQTPVLVGKTDGYNTWELSKSGKIPEDWWYTEEQIRRRDEVSRETEEKRKWEEEGRRVNEEREKRWKEGMKGDWGFGRSILLALYLPIKHISNQVFPPQNVSQPIECFFDLLLGPIPPNEKMLQEDTIRFSDVEVRLFGWIQALIR
jgi:hypothetical protein